MRHTTQIGKHIAMPIAAPLPLWERASQSVDPNSVG